MISFFFGVVVYIGFGLVKDVFLIINRMIVFFIIDNLLIKVGFKVNFIIGYYLGILGKRIRDCMLYCNF